MRWFNPIAVSLVLAFGLGACGDDDKKTDTTDAADTGQDSAPGDTSDTTNTDTVTTTDVPDTTATEVTEDADTGPDDTDVVEPPPTFPEFVIDLIENHTADDTLPVPYTEFSTLEDDDTPTVFQSLFE